jgi:hypothetical protein
MKLPDCIAFISWPVNNCVERNNGKSCSESGFHKQNQLFICTFKQHTQNKRCNKNKKNARCVLRTTHLLLALSLSLSLQLWMKVFIALAHATQLNYRLSRIYVRAPCLSHMHPKTNASAGGGGGKSHRSAPNTDQPSVRYFPSGRLINN